MGQRYPGPAKDGNGDGKAQREWFAEALQAFALHPSIAGQQQSIAFPARNGATGYMGSWTVYQLIEDFARANPTLSVVIVASTAGRGPSGRSAEF